MIFGEGLETKGSIIRMRAGLTLISFRQIAAEEPPLYPVFGLSGAEDSKKIAGGENPDQDQHRQIFPERESGVSGFQGHKITLQRTAAVEELEHVTLVGLLPLDAVGWIRSDIQPLDVRAGHQFARPLAIVGEG